MRACHVYGIRGVQTGAWDPLPPGAAQGLPLGNLPVMFMFCSCVLKVGHLKLRNT